jgi:hypothetical protein
MSTGSQLRLMLTAWFPLLAMLAAPSAMGQVNVTISGNQALATISLPSGDGTVDADVTITFDSPVNLSAVELNLSASVVDPNDPTLLARLGCPEVPGCLLGIDPAFPLLITVEPLEVPWMFRSGFESDDNTGNLSFLNAYEFEIHTPDLDCAAAMIGLPCAATAYRLFKGPVSGDFHDITTEMLKGSVRARGRGGAFSQFMIVADNRSSLSVEQAKALDLESRIVSASIDEDLRTDLLGRLAAVQVATLVDSDYATALADLDELIGVVQLNAGITIPNRWSSDAGGANDAGEMEALAQTLRYTLALLNSGS